MSFRNQASFFLLRQDVAMTYSSDSGSAAALSSPIAYCTLQTVAPLHFDPAAPKVDTPPPHHPTCSAKWMIGKVTCALTVRGLSIGSLATDGKAANATSELKIICS